MMPPEELDALMAELKAWCKAKHGRQKELSEKIGVSEDTISHWIARRKTPGLVKYFELQVFLKQQRRGRKKPEMD
jgi:transcriptional regulator with XRE-family HTH domain